MTPAICNLPDQPEGVTFDGLSYRMTVDGAPTNLIGAQIYMVITNSSNLPVAYFNVGSGIAITDGADGRFVLLPFNIVYPVGNYNYSMTFTFSNGVVKRYIIGGFQVIPA